MIGCFVKAKRLSVVADSGGADPTSAELFGAGMDCGKFTPGHLVHWIQWRKVNEEGDMMPARLLTADPDSDSLTVDVDGVRLEAWNHNVARIIEQVQEADRVSYSPRWSVLQCDTSYHYLATDAEHWQPACATPALEDGTSSAEALLEQLKEFGGFTLEVEHEPSGGSQVAPDIGLRPGVRSAVAAVQLLTGLDEGAARTVVFDDDHSLYDGGQVGFLDDPDEPLEIEVRSVVADCLNEEWTAGAFPVAVLLSAMDAGLASAYGETLELRLLDDALVLIGENDWGNIELRNEQDGVDFVPTGVDGDCPDPFVVATALARLAPRHPDAI